MKHVFNILILLILSVGYCHVGIAQELFPVNGTLFGRPVEVSVDHELARIMLEAPTDSTVLQLFSDYGAQPINTETLSEIACRYSADVAALFFAEILYEQEKNQLAQDYYLSEINASSPIVPSPHLIRDYHIVFIPGLRYEHAVNGSDFISQRSFCDSLGISNEMVKIKEVGPARDNAVIIADRLREINELHNNIVVISVSKGGLDAALALDMLSFEEICSVKAWINVCGILKGTPMADTWRKPLRRSLLSLGLFFSGEKVKVKKLLTSMSYDLGKEEYSGLKIPEEILTISLTTVPLGHERKKTKMPIPNDGFSPLADSIIGNEVVVLEVGPDHYFRGVDLNSRMVVLMNYIVDQLVNNINFD